MKPDQERVKNLLTDTVTLLCRNGLSFHDELRVEGLIGITLDNNEVFLVHINEKFGGGSAGPPVPMDLLASNKAADSGLSEDSYDFHSKSSDNNDKNKCNTSTSKAASPSKPCPASDSKPRVNSSKEDVKPSVRVVNVKSEPVDDDEDLVIVSAKSEFPSSCSFQNNSHSSEPRVPPLHEVPQGDFASLQQSISMGTTDPDSDTGEPAIKRRHSEEDDEGDEEPPGGAFVAGVAQNLLDQSPQSSNASWPIGGLPPEFAAQMAGGVDGQWPSLGSPMPGTSSQLGATPEQMLCMLGSIRRAFSSPRRQPVEAEKRYECTVEDCGKRFYHIHHLYRHERIKHGKRITPTGKYHY